MRRADVLRVGGYDEAFAYGEDLTLFSQPIAQQVGTDGFRTTIRDLMTRAITRSDNTANDVLLWQAGGPEAVRAFTSFTGNSDGSVSFDDQDLLTLEPEDTRRAAVLVVTSDRGLAGAYSSNVIKEAERLVEKLKEEGKEVDLYVTGRKGEGYYKFRNRPVVQAWTGFSDQPTYDVAADIGETLIAAFLDDVVSTCQSLVTINRNELVVDTGDPTRTPVGRSGATEAAGR